VDRVHQGLAGSVFMIEPVEIVAADLKGGNASGRVLDPDSAQVATFGQDECPDEDIRGLVMLGDKSSPPFAPPTWIFPERYDRRRVSSASRRGVSQAHQLSPLAKDRKLMGFFLNIFLPSITLPVR